MSSCTNTLRNLLPLWTSKVWPTNSGVTVAPGIPECHVDPVEVAELADRRAAGAAHAAHLSRRQDDDRPVAFLGPQAADAAGRAHQLAALARIHFDVVDLQTRRDV